MQTINIYINSPNANDPSSLQVQPKKVELSKLENVTSKVAVGTVRAHKAALHVTTRTVKAVSNQVSKAASYIIGLVLKTALTAAI
jgi:hypothetical protein